MRRSTVVRWAALCVGLLLCPLLSGCLAAGAAWPSVAVTPPLQVNAPADQIHAFRVEATKTAPTVEFPEPGVYKLREFSVAEGGWVGPQGNVACDYGWYFGAIPLSYWKLKQHTVMVRLYRPGCQTVEVTAWGLPKEVEWRGVADLAGQEKAVDDLMSLGATDVWGDVPEREEGRKWVTRRLGTGSESPEHRKALLFAASEYDRLAKSAPDDAVSRVIRDRMEKKAAWLRDQAAK